MALYSADLLVGTEDLFVSRAVSGGADAAVLHYSINGASEARPNSDSVYTCMACLCDPRDSGIYCCILHRTRTSD